MWSYYGGKGSIAKYYPKPTEDRINECFCGAANYSLLYFEKEITLIDKSPTIISVWHFLQQASKKDILSLPEFIAGTRIKRETFDCDGQYNLMKFLITLASYGGGNIVSEWGAKNFIKNKKKVADNLFKCKHWTIKQGEYFDIDNGVATWFIDPPYTNGGNKYPMQAKYIDFKELAEWCKTRNGQTIVCENTKADWLPFVPFKKIQGVVHKTTEAIWTNYHTHFNNVQQTLF